MLGRASDVRKEYRSGHKVMSENQLENARAANGLLRTKLDLVTEENDALRARLSDYEALLSRVEFLEKHRCPDCRFDGLAVTPCVRHHGCEHGLSPEMCGVLGYDHAWDETWEHQKKRAEYAEAERDALHARVEELENEMQSKEKNEEWPQFLEDTEETVFDCTTSLIWQKDHAGPMSWQEAIDYASKLELAGHSDWRLPTIEELITLIDFGKHDPASVFPNMPSKRFWSSSPYSENYAWGAYFRNGYVLDNFVYYDYCVRCVRP